MCIVVGAAADPGHFRRFPDFRFISGLPGGGYGVTPEGAPGFNGATQISIPVAYTPSGCSFIAAAHVGQLTDDFELDLYGDKVNGNLTLAIGLGDPGKGWYLADMETSSAWESSYNIQKQVQASTDKRPGIAVGLLDILDQREFSANQGDGGARSLYVVGTKEVGRSDRPTYVTLGVGTGRFHNRPFGGVSHRLCERAAGMVEYDGYSGNIGASVSLLPDPAERDHNLTLLVGYVDVTDRAQFLGGVTYTFSTHSRPSAESARDQEGRPNVRVLRRGPVRRVPVPK
jgi:hypothetical protein